MILLSVSQIAGGSPVMNSTNGDQGEESRPCAHTIDIRNPYMGVPPMEPGRG